MSVCTSKATERRYLADYVLNGFALMLSAVPRARWYDVLIASSVPVVNSRAGFDDPQWKGSRAKQHCAGVCKLQDRSATETALRLPAPSSAGGGCHCMRPPA